MLLREFSFGHARQLELTLHLGSELNVWSLPHRGFGSSRAQIAVRRVDQELCLSRREPRIALFHPGYDLIR